MSKSKRTSIVKALSQKFKLINGTGQYKVNLFNNSYAKLKFWDEVKDFPAVYVTAGTEVREYHPSGFTWGFLGVAIKVYCKGETAQEQLELLLGDIETVIEANRQLVYDSTNNYETTEILVQSITTDEGLLAPYAIGEINLQVRYELV
jgi:hypothetical protein